MTDFKKYTSLEESNSVASDRTIPLDSAEEKFLKRHNDLERQYGTVEISFQGLCDTLKQYHYEASKEAREEAKWISVEDKRPEIGAIVNLVLSHSKNDVYSGFRANGGWYCFRIGEESKYYVPNGIDNVKITHWQPLPPPPFLKSKEEGK